MRIVARVLAIIFGIATLGLMSQGNLNPLILILAAVLGYFGWRTKSQKE